METCPSRWRLTTACLASVGPPSGCLYKQPMTELLQGDRALFKALFDQFQQFGIFGPRQTASVAPTEGRAAGTRVLESHTVITVHIPHGVLHDLDTLLVPCAVHQIERLTRPRHDPELKLELESGPTQSIPVGLKPYAPTLGRTTFLVRRLPVLAAAEHDIESFWL